MLYAKMVSKPAFKCVCLSKLPISGMIDKCACTYQNTKSNLNTTYSVKCFIKYNVKLFFKYFIILTILLPCCFQNDCNYYNITQNYLLMFGFIIAFTDVLLAVGLQLLAVGLPFQAIFNSHIFSSFAR